jgi:LemA protein
MKRSWIVIIVIAVLVLFFANSGCGSYNALVVAKERVGNAWAQVDNQLQRRNDLIGNLVETVKGTAIQEQEVFGQIADARARMSGGGARTPEEGIAAGRAMDSALSRLLVVIENYPQLRSNEAFMQLMDEISGTENRLSTERGRYNGEVQAYNVLVKRFPMNLFAGLFGFKESPYYQIPEEARTAPRVNMQDLRRDSLPR